MSDLSQFVRKNHQQADWFALKKVSENATYRIVRDQKPANNYTYFNSGVMVEVIMNGHLGYAGTCDTTEAGIMAALQKAKMLALANKKAQLHASTEALRPQAQGEYHSSFEKSVDSMTAGEINDVLISACKNLKVSDKITSTRATAMIVDTEYEYISTNGSEVQQKYLMISTDYAATATSGGETQTRSDHGGLAKCYQIGLEVFNREQISTLCNQIGAEAIELLSAEDCPSDTRDLLLMPDQMLLQIHESIGHPLEIDRILGDERNYAGWSFIKPQDFNNLQYGSHLMNVTFNPGVQHELASYAFDESGKKATREYLIKEGRLLRGLGSLESETRSQLLGVANFRSSSWNRAPIDRMANINLEPGPHTVEDMIKATEKGVLMTSNRSWSIDDYRNKFQFGCEYGKLIENGQLTKTVKNPNYRGKTISFWNSLKMVGQDTEMYGSPYCGKGEPNQIIRVGHSSPACLFSQVEVFGAGK